MTDIPNHLLSIIFKAADFDINTKVALRIRPQKNVNRYISKEAHEKLSKFFETRVQQYKTPDPAIVRFEKTLKSPNDSDTFNIHVWVISRNRHNGSDGRTIMSIEFDRSSSDALHANFTSIICDVQTGEIIEKP